MVFALKKSGFTLLQLFCILPFPETCLRHDSSNNTDVPEPLQRACQTASSASHALKECFALPYPDWLLA